MWKSMARSFRPTLARPLPQCWPPHGRRTLHHTETGHAPRGLYCGIGLCFGCLVTVDGVAGVRACVTQVRAGMCIVTDDEPEDQP